MIIKFDTKCYVFHTTYIIYDWDICWINLSFFVNVVVNYNCIELTNKKTKI